MDLDLFDIRTMADLAMMMGDTGKLMDLLRQHAEEFMVHTEEIDDERLWCLHLPHILGEGEEKDPVFRSDNLNHVLYSGVVKSVEHIWFIRQAANLN
jgi:hypothetical protein